MTDSIIDIHKKLTTPALNNNWEVSREGHLFKRERASILNYYTNQTPEGSNGFTLIGILPTLEKTKKKILHTYLYGRGIISVCIVPGWWITKKRRKQKRWKLILLGCRTGEGTRSALVEEKSSLYYRGGFLFCPEDYLSVAVMAFWRFFNSDGKTIPKSIWSRLF